MTERWVSSMVNQLGKPIHDINNKEIESSTHFVLNTNKFIYPSDTVKLMENKEELLPIGTKVYIKDDSEHFRQGVKDGEKLIGIIMGHMSVECAHREYIYEIEWNGDSRTTNSYQGCDVEPVEPIEEVNEEEINNELKQLFNQILNN